jgi:hypothetical protein
MNLSIKDLAELTGAPPEQLHRVICMTATAGFLRLTPSDMVAHTPLSAHFMANRSLLDAAVFMAETVAPAALKMPLATQRFGDSLDPSETAYNLALETSKTFSAACQAPKLARQWAAYLHYAAGLHQEEKVVGLLSQLNWSNLGDACIVEVSEFLSCPSLLVLYCDPVLTEPLCGRSAPTLLRRHNSSLNSTRTYAWSCRCSRSRPRQIRQSATTASRAATCP